MGGQILKMTLSWELNIVQKLTKKNSSPMSASEHDKIMVGVSTRGWLYSDCVSSRLGPRLL